MSIKNDTFTVETAANGTVRVIINKYKKRALGSTPVTARDLFDWTLHEPLRQALNKMEDGTYTIAIYLEPKGDK